MQAVGRQAQAHVGSPEVRPVAVAGEQGITLGVLRSRVGNLARHHLPLLTGPTSTLPCVQIASSTAQYWWASQRQLAYIGVMSIVSWPAPNPSPLPRGAVTSRLPTK